MMNKRALLKKIIAQLDAELTLYAKAARAAHAEATHEQNKAENKYDTRGLEASYLARGQSKQAGEAATARDEFAALSARAFEPEEPISVGALVELEGAGARSWYFLGPRAGGLEIVLGAQEILVITPPSPLGSQLMGRKAGERLQLQLGGKNEAYRVVSVA